MRRLFIAGAAVLWWGAATLSLFARGGGGCLEQGTLIATPSGRVPVEQLRPGDTVVSVSHGATAQATVQSVMRVQPDEYCELVIAGHALNVTAEHPIETSPGVFRMAAFLRAGDQVCCWNDNRAETAQVVSATRGAGTRPAFNLLVTPGGTFVAGDVVMHNKGCFLPETLIRRADGSEVSIAAVQAGDRLLAFAADGAMATATVQRVLTHTVDEYRVVRTASMVVHVTPEHPFYTGDGTFKTLEALRVGDFIFAFDGRGLSAQRIESLETVRANVRVYNLQTDAPNTFFANGMAVHNKGGGCFPAGTLIHTPAGAVPIERVGAGDVVMSFDEEGRPAVARVYATHVTRSVVLSVETQRALLKTTREHPIALAGGGFCPAGDLAAGDAILIWRDGQLVADTVISVQSQDGEEEVYNLTVDAPHVFLADDFLVHNKGGGGFHSSSSSHSGSSGGASGGNPLGFMIVVGAVVFILIALAKVKGETQDLDFVYSPSQVARKGAKTLKLLEFLAKQDPAMAPEGLRKQAETTFLKLQECWQARDYGPMKPLMMPDLYAEHCLQIQGMIRDHEIDLLEGLRVDRIDLVNVRYTFKEEQREFTALFTATARDYYVDDRTRRQVRGDDAPAQFQEFWTFQRRNQTWLLRDIEQTKESDALKEENFFEQFTDTGLEQIYGESAGKGGPSGPWLEKEVETKDTRIERMLNFLVETDKLWNRQAMLETARRVFLQMMAAWESGDPAAVPDGELFPDVAAGLRDAVGRNKAQGVTLEFRNLCVRKVELILVANRADNRQDELNVRVRAHAQKCVRKQDALVHQDADVTPFEQCLTFGRLDNRWKLKEMLAPAAAQKAIALENVDQDSSPEQVQWYYQHKRAV